MPEPELDPSAAAVLLAERVRSALVEHAIAVFTDAGVRGLCCEGAWEAAVTALRKLDLTPLCSTDPPRGWE